MKTRLIVLLIALGLLASSAYSDTVIVRQEGDYGWDIEVNRYGLGYFTAGGPVWYETTGGFPSGEGAFYAMCQAGGTTVADKTPDTVWLGLDTFNAQPLAGIKLNQIKSLIYTCYVSDMPNMNMAAPFSTYNEWKYPREPICLQFVINDDLGNRRNLWFRPWSAKPEGGGYGGSPATQMGQWVTYDCINCTSQATGTTSTIAPIWNEPITNRIFATWADVCGYFGEWSLVATAPVGDYYHTAGWDGTTIPTGTPTATATGMPLNFEVGARKFQYKDIWGATAGKNWYPESINFRGYVDTFTMGIDYGTPEAPDVVERTFDFEPAPGVVKPRLVTCNLGSLVQGDGDLNGTNNRVNYAAIWDNSNCWKHFLTRLFGKSGVTVTQVVEGAYCEDGTSFTGTYFEITDGSSGIPVPVIVRVKDPDSTFYNQVLWGEEFIGITGDVRRRPTGLIKERWVWGHVGQANDYTYVPAP